MIIAFILSVLTLCSSDLDILAFSNLGDKVVTLMDTFSGGCREDTERVDGIKVAAMEIAMTRLSFWIRISLMAVLAVVMVLLGVGLSY